MIRSFRWRLGLGFAGISAGTVLLAALAVNIVFGSRFDTYLEQQRAARLQQIVAAVSGVYEATGRWDVARLDDLASAVAMAGAEARLADAVGTPIWPTDDRAAQMAAMHRSMMAAGPLTSPVSVPITVDGARRGTLEVRLPEGSLPAADRQLRIGVNRLLLGGGLLVAVLAAGSGMIFARRVTRPVAELTDAARDLHAGDRSRRTAVTGHDEVAELARAFNELAESAERQEALRQSFAADVAHELRTPLAILRSQLEAAQDGVLPLTPELVSSLHEEALRLARLVADLETLTSAEAVSFSVERLPVDLAAVARAVIAGLQPRLAEAGLEVDTRLVTAPVCGDPMRLSQVVGNLLTNAVKFVPRGGRVTVGTAHGSGVSRLTVGDDGPGIPDDELPRVFDRYFRGSRARANGSGVGLAVVAALVHAHGGTVQAGRGPQGGAVFTVELPADAPGRARDPHARHRCEDAR